MSDHLPECVIPTPELGVWVCICNRLRACEERVTAGAVQRVEALRVMFSAHDVGLLDDVIAAIKGDQP